VQFALPTNCGCERLRLPASGADQQLDPTHTKASINTFVLYTRFFSCGLIAAVIPSEGKPSNEQFVRREFPMTQLAHAKRIPHHPNRKVIYTTKAHTTGAKGGSSMTMLARSTTRHLGTLCRQKQPRRAICLPPRRAQEAEPRHSNLGRLQKGRSSADLNGAPRHRRWQAPAPLHF
jgi:hypothetical protein